MRLRRMGRLLPLALLLPRAAAWSWFDTGHLVVAEIAYRELQPSVRAEVDRLVRIGTDPKTNTFVTAACYLDDLKDRTGAHREWHYINLPFSPDGTPLPASLEAENVLTALHQAVAQLEDRNNPPAVRAEALRAILHLVGDVHQPLHCATRYTAAQPQGDRGGNGFKIKGAWVGRERVDNLHLYWDSALGLLAPVERPLTPGGRRYVRYLADWLTSAFPRVRLLQWRNQDPRQWALESHNLALRYAYGGLREGWKPSLGYLSRGRWIARQRLALAGYRLADLLNRILGGGAA